MVVNRSQTAPITSPVEETKSRVGGDLQKKYDQVVKEISFFSENVREKVPVLLEAVNNGLIPTVNGDPNHFVIIKGQGSMC